MPRAACPIRAHGVGFSYCPRRSFIKLVSSGILIEVNQSVGGCLWALKGHSHIQRFTAVAAGQWLSMCVERFIYIDMSDS